MSKLMTFPRNPVCSNLNNMSLNDLVTCSISKSDLIIAVAMAPADVPDTIVSDLIIWLSRRQLITPKINLDN